MTAAATRAIARLVFAALAACLPSTALRAADSDKIAAAVERAVRPILQEHDVPGMAVAVTVDGRQHFFSYGVLSKAGNAPVTKETLFEIGSVSKMFTATLAGYAQATGKLSLDDHPSKFMPQWRGSDLDKASLLNLGTFTAGGLPLQFPPEVATNARMTAYFQRWKASAPPGVQRRYSNPSIGLLGHLTSLAMNRSFAELMDSELLPKVALSNSYIRVPKAKMDAYAWGHDKANKPIRAAAAVFDAEAYGVKSTAADMIRFVEANIEPEKLEAPVRRAVEGTQVGHFSVGAMVQGLGWEQYPYPVTLQRLLAGNAYEMAYQPQAATPLSPPRAPAEPTLFNKTGSTNGFGAYVAFVPARRIGVVMLANKNYPVPARITAAHAVLEQLAALAGDRRSQR